jgi:hypothetical protein
MNALILYGGWDGHEPGPCSELIDEALQADGFETRRENSLDPLADEAAMQDVDVIVPIWTMGELGEEQFKGLDAAVTGGVGLAGFHGGMGDAFRGPAGHHLRFQWMVGGQFVAHPHVGPYRVRLTGVNHPATDGMAAEFEYDSEQYYQLVDPAVTVLADTLFDRDGMRAVLPCVWCRTWGRGRVFYSALGHVAEEFRRYPEVLAMTVRGIRWAAEGRSAG